MAKSPALTPLSPARPAAPAAAPEPCGLESLIRPNFFAGQLLADADLKALLVWVQRHRGLQRYRGGWGVVCGLDVTPDLKTSGQVIVAPGYAVGPCGADLIVPTAATHAFADLCQAGDPCSGTAGPAIDGDIDFGGVTAPAKDVRVAQVSLQGKPFPMQPQPALGRPATGPNGTACDYARIKECFEIVHQPIDLSGLLNPPAQPPAPPAPPGVLDAFKNDFPDLYSKDLGTPSTPPDPQKVRAWFQARLGDPATGPRRFAAVAALLDGLSDDEVVTKWKLVPPLFWMLLDERLAAESPACPTTTGRCVPLARVWLWKKPGGCVVMRIDAWPPYRRPVGPDEPPTPGRLAPLYWAPLSDAQNALSARGVTVAGKEPLTLPATPEALTALLAGADQVVQANSPDKVVAQTWADNVVPKAAVERVVGFTKRDAPRTALGADVTSVSWLPADRGAFPDQELPQPFPPGAKGVARVAVGNKDVAMTFTPLLHAGGVLVLKGPDQRIDAKQPGTWETGVFTLPDKAPPDGYLRLTVCGAADDGRSIVVSPPDGKPIQEPIAGVVADFTAAIEMPSGTQVVPTVLPGLQMIASVGIASPSVAVAFNLTTATATFTLKPGDPSRTLLIPVPADAKGPDWTASLQGTVTDIFGRQVQGHGAVKPPDLIPPQKLSLLSAPVELKLDQNVCHLKITNNTNSALSIQSLAVRPLGQGQFTAPTPPAPQTVNNGSSLRFDFTYQPSDPNDKTSPVCVIDALLFVSGSRFDVHGAVTAS